MMSAVSDDFGRRSDAGGAEGEASPRAIEAENGGRCSDRRLVRDALAREPSPRRAGIDTTEFARVPEATVRERFARWLD